MNKQMQERTCSNCYYYTAICAKMSNESCDNHRFTSEVKQCNQIIQGLSKHTIVSVLEELSEFFRRADKTEFIAVFSTRIGTHLWNKLAEDYKGDFGSLLCTLDSSNLQLLAEHLKKKTVEYAER